MNFFRKPIFFILLTAIVFIFLSWVFSSIFIYLVVSIILSTILRPLTNYLSNQQMFNIRLPRVLAVFISFFSLILLLSAFVTLFLPLISDQIQIFTSIDLEKVIARIDVPLQALETFILKYQLGNYEQGFLEQSIKDGFTNIILDVKVTSIVENLISLTGNVFVGLMAIHLLLFSSFMKRGFLENISSTLFQMTTSRSQSLGCIK